MGFLCLTKGTLCHIIKTIRRDMIEARKQKLLNYLYPREEIARFMICDFYVELALLLDKKICFSANNIKKEERQKNLKLAREIVYSFLQNNENYLKRAQDYFPTKDINSLITDILYGYLLLVSSNINRGTGADIFLDKRSICYSKTSIIDIL